MSITLVNAIMNDFGTATIYNTGIHSGKGIKDYLFRNSPVSTIGEWQKMNVKLSDIKKGTLLRSASNSTFLVSSIERNGDIITINGKGNDSRSAIVVNTYYGCLLGWYIVIQ